MKRLIGSLVFCSMLACATAQKPVAEVQSVDPLLANLSRDAIRPAELRGKVVLVDIWASWCQPCAEALPFLAQLRDELGKDDLELVTVNVDADRRAATAFLKGLGLEEKILVLNDPEAKQVEKELGILRLPTTLFIDRTGRVRFVESGFFESTKNSARTRAKQLLAEKPPVASTP